MPSNSKNVVPAAAMVYGAREKVEVFVDSIWFPATVLDCISENIYMVQYLVRKEGGEDVLQKTKVGTQHIRPTPPQHKSKTHFSLFNRVEAYYDRAWSSGIITEIKDKKFTVSLKRANKEMTFSESNLRPCMEWVDDRWIDVSEPNVDDDDASQSSPSKILNIQNAAQEAKTPTSTACQTDIGATESHNISSAKTRSHSLDKKVAKAADTSYSKPQRKSKIENVAEIVMSTGCKSNGMKRKTPGKQNTSREPESFTVYHNDAAALKSCSLDDKVPMVADNDASHSKPSEKSKMVNATEITGSTDCRTDAAKTKRKQNASENLKTPTSTVSQTEHESRSLNEKVPMVADNDASHSKPSEKSKMVNATEFTGSTDCRTDGAKTKRKQNASENLKTPTFTVSQTEHESRSLNEKVPMVADNDALHSKPSEKSKMVNATEFTGSTDCRTDGAKTKRKQNASENLKTPTFTVSQTEHESHSLNEKVPMVADNDASHSKPSEKSKMVNATEITGSTDCRTDGAKTKRKQNASENLKTPTSTVSQTEHESRSLNEKVLTASHSRPSKKSKLENAAEITTPTCETDAMKTRSRSKQNASQEPKTPTSIVYPTAVIALESPINPSLENGSCSLDNKLTTGSGQINKPVKRRGRPPKTPNSSRGDNKNKATARTAEGTNGKDCNTEHFVMSPNVVMGSPQDNVPLQSHIGGHTSKSVQTGQRHDPAGLVIECPTNRQREHMEISTDQSGPMSKIEMPTKSGEKAKQVECSQQKKLSARKGGKTSPNPSAKSDHLTCDGVSLGETEVQEVAIDSSPRNDMDVNQILPFTKIVDVWDRLEAMPVFQSFPQKPHFRPLERSSENTREGLALAHMLTFCKIVNKMSELGLDMARSDMVESLNDLEALQENGFDVKYIRDALNDLIGAKDKLDRLQKAVEGYKQSMMESNNKKAELDEVVDELNKNLIEREAKLKESVSKKEKYDASLAVSRSSLDRISSHIKSAQSDLEESAALGYRA